MPYPIAAVRGKNFGSPTIPWYLSGGIAAANCLAAFQPKGAADAAAALVNLANPGTYNASNGVAYPAWDTAVGWTFTAASSQYLDIGGGSGPTLKPFSVLAGIIIGDTATNRYILGGKAKFSMEFKVDTAEKINITSKNSVSIGNSSSAVTTGELRVCGFTYSAVGAYVPYIAGSSSGGGTQDATISVDTDLIGWDSGTAYFNGVITTLAIYNTVLTAAQMLAVSTVMAAL